MTQTTGGNAATAGRLVLLRPGPTVWSESGQHTGRTDIPLTAEGERQARDAGTRIQTAFPQGFGENCVYASPLKRAQQTASLAGFAPRTLPALAEWDYGRAEGRTRQTIAQLHGGSWELWNDGPDALSPTMEGDWTETLPDGEQVPVHNGPGESLSDVYDRVQQSRLHRIQSRINDNLFIIWFPDFVKFRVINYCHIPVFVNVLCQRTDCIQRKIRMFWKCVCIKRQN